MRSKTSSVPRYLLLLLLGVGVFWGLNWQVMKIGLREIPPIWFRGSTALIAGIAMLVLTRVSGRRVIPPPGAWRTLSWLAATNIFAWGVLSIYGLSMLPSGRAALLAYTMPVWSILISTYWLRERITRLQLVSIVLGVLGVFAMMGAELTEITGHPTGAILMVAAAFVWGLGIVSIKRFPVALPILSFSGWMMLLGGLMLTATALLFETMPDWNRLGNGSLFALLYNVFIALMFCNWAWNSIVLRLPVTVSSLSSLIVPVFGVSGGMALLGEKPGIAEWIGMACILGAVAAVIFPKKEKREG